MRLTNFLRDAFVRAAMQDVPKIDYQGQAEKLARDAIKAKFAKDFPDMDYAKAGATGWFRGDSIALPYNINNISANPAKGYDMLKSDTKLWVKLEELSKLKQEQAAAHAALESKLQAVAYACTTRKQLQEALPEFETYLPAEEAKVAKNLPAVANVLSDFVKAGWPKNQRVKVN